MMGNALSLKKTVIKVISKRTTINSYSATVTAENLLTLECYRLFTFTLTLTSKIN